jgi:hypothetical protein
MMNAVNEFSVVGGLGASDYYAAPGLTGVAGGFIAYCVCAPIADSSVGHIVGNMDLVGNKGWRIFTSNAGVHAEVGDGSTVVAVNGGDCTGKLALVQLSVQPYDGSHTRIGIYINGRLVHTDNTLTAAFAPTVGKQFSVGYDVNGPADPAGASLVAGFGMLVGAGASVSLAGGLPLWMAEGAMAMAPDGQLAQFYKALYSPGNNTPASTYLTAYRAMFDNDGAHPPAQAGAAQPAGASWTPYISQAGVPVLTRTGAPLVATVRVPWA